MFKLAISSGLLYKSLGKLLERSGTRLPADVRKKLSVQAKALMEGAVKRDVSAPGVGAHKAHADLMHLQAKVERVGIPSEELRKLVPTGSDIKPHADLVNVMKGNRARGYPYSSKFRRVRNYASSAGEEL